METTCNLCRGEIQGEPTHCRICDADYHYECFMKHFVAADEMSVESRSKLIGHPQH